MFYIVLLVFFGLLFLVAELVLLPGVSIGALFIVINTITVTHDKPQTGTSNVNIYAKDLKLRIKGKEQRKADRERLRTIGDALVAYLNAQNIADLEYWIESDIVIKELEVNQHYRNIRISWNIH